MYVGERAAINPERAAAIFEPSGTVVTYRHLDDDSNRIAQLLWEAGVRPGDSIALVVENSPPFLNVVWAAQRSGLRYTAISTALTADEIAYIVDDCDAKVLFGSGVYADRLGDIAEQTSQVEYRFSIGGEVPGFTALEDRMAQVPAAPLEQEYEGADMLYSSGTTGRPKGVKPEMELAEAGNPPPITALMKLVWGFGEATSYLSPAPLYHAAPLRFVLACHRFGGTSIIMEEWDAELALRLLEKHSCTHAQFVPTHFVRMLRLPDGLRGAVDLSSLEVVLHAAAPCPIEVKQKMMDWFGPIIHEYYGATEGNGVTAVAPDVWLKHPGTVGSELLGTIHILDDDGTELAPGEVGTIWFEGGPRFEYHKDSEKTAAAHNDEGWSTMGDVGYVDDDGFLFLTDRKAYTIITGGVNVYPQEAENVLTLHPAVRDVAVFGVPNEDFGEEVMAVVSLREGHQPNTEVEADLIQYCRDRLSTIKCPRSVDFREELPRTETGKLLKRLIRDEYWERADASTS